MNKRPERLASLVFLVEWLGFLLPNHSCHEDKELGFAFAYPKEWGNIIASDLEDFYHVNGDGDVGSPKTEMKKYGYSLKPEGVSQSESFFVGADPMMTGVLGRGAWWGDRAKKITSFENLKEFCGQQIDCRMLSNPYGLQYAKVVLPALAPWYAATESFDTVQYFLFDEGARYPSLTLSPDNMLKADDTEKARELEKAFDEMIQSFHFVD